jgi:hypothetical protein
MTPRIELVRHQSTIISYSNESTLTTIFSFVDRPPQEVTCFRFCSSHINGDDAIFGLHSIFSASELCSISESCPTDDPIELALGGGNEQRGFVTDKPITAPDGKDEQLRRVDNCFHAYNNVSTISELPIIIFLNL